MKELGVITKRNIDNSGNPVLLDINGESKQVLKSLIFLNEVPSFAHKVRINGMREIPYDKTITSENEFKVHYTFGFVCFHASKEGHNITITNYKGIGYALMDASRIVTKWSPTGDIEGTLDEALDEFEFNSKQLLARIEHEWREQSQNIADEWDNQSETINAQWTEFMRNVQQEWLNKVNSVNAEWSAIKNRVNTEWDDKKHIVDTEWSVKKQTIDTEWSNKKILVDDEWKDIKEDVDQEFTSRKNTIDRQISDTREFLEDSEERMSEINAQNEQNIDNIQDAIHNKDNNFKVKFHEYVATQNTDDFYIPSDEFNEVIDSISMYYNGAYMHKGQQYDIIGSRVRLINWFLPKGESIQYQILRSGQLPSLDNIGVITKPMLSPDLQNEMDGLNNQSFIINEADWVKNEDGIYEYTLNHERNSKNIIASFYDTTGATEMFCTYECVDFNNIKVYNETNFEIKVVIAISYYGYQGEIHTLASFDTDDLVQTKDKQYVNEEEKAQLRDLANGGGGGIKTCQTIEERDDIPMEKRREGMLCYVIDMRETYQLKNGIENENWEVFSGGGGGALVGTLTSDLPYSLNGFGDAPLIALATDEILKVPYFFRSPNLGNGTVYVYFENELIESKSVKQGVNYFEFSEPLPKQPLPYQMRIVVEDKGGLLTNEIYLRFKVGVLEVTCNFDDSKEYYTNHYFRLPYSVDSADENPIVVSKYINGNLTEEITITDKTQTYYFDIGYLTPNRYKVEIHVRSGETKGNVIVKNLIVASSDMPAIYTDMDTNLTFTSDEPIVLKYRTSMAGKKELHVRFFENGALVSRGNVKTGQSEWIVGLKPVGEYNFSMTVETVPVGDAEQGEVVGDIPVEFNVTVTKGTFEKQPHVTSGLIGYFNAQGKSNDSLDKSVWENRIEGGSKLTLHGLNYTANNGWIQTGLESYLKLTGESYAILDYKPFLMDYDGSKNGVGGVPIDGWTFDVLLRSNNVGNEFAKSVSCLAPDAPFHGFYIDTQYAYFGSRLENMKTVIQNDEWVRVTYVINRHATNDGGGVLFIYINGVVARIKNLDKVAVESFESDQKIYFNCELDSHGQLGNFGACDIKTIRIYDRALDGSEIVQNYIADIEDLSKQQEAVNANSALSKIPVMKFFREYKDGKPVYEFGDPKQKNRVPVRVEYNGVLGSYGDSFVIDDYVSELAYQGTSSLQYEKKNYKIRLKYKDAETGKVAKYKFTPFPVGGDRIPQGYSPWIPEDTFTIKCNYMESSHASNVGNARLAHDMYKAVRSDGTGSEVRLVPPQFPEYQMANIDYIRSSMDGFPVRIELDGVDQGVHVFLVDKGANDTFGLDNKKFPFVQSFEMASNSDVGAGAFKDDSLEAIHAQFEIRKVPKQQLDDAGNLKIFSGDEQDLYEDVWWNARKPHPTNPSETVFDEEVAKQATPHHLVRIIRWVKNIGERFDEAVKNGNTAEQEAVLSEFRDAINRGERFDKGYLIDYFIQTMMTGLVDNFGFWLK